MEVEGGSNGERSAAFLNRLREGHPRPLMVIWNNAPAHRGEVLADRGM